MDGLRDYDTKQSKSDKDKNHMISLICRIYIYNIYMCVYIYIYTSDLIYKTETHS